MIKGISVRAEVNIEAKKTKIQYEMGAMRGLHLVTWGCDWLGVLSFTGSAGACSAAGSGAGALFLAPMAPFWVRFEGRVLRLLVCCRAGVPWVDGLRLWWGRRVKTGWSASGVAPTAGCIRSEKLY